MRLKDYIFKDGKVYRKGTLAQFLDKREIAEGEPTKNDLPETINPFKFMMSNLLGNNCSIIKLKHSEMKYSTDMLYLLKDLIPAGKAILLYIDVDDIECDVKLKTTDSVDVLPVSSVEEDAPITVSDSVMVAKLEDNC